MQPLKVTITLRTPMIEPEHPIHLDGLLGALKVSEAMRHLGESIDPRQHHHDIPLERHEGGAGQWCFKASVFSAGSITRHGLWMQTGRLSLTEAARHREEGWLALRAAKANPAGGPFKTSIYHEPVMLADLGAFCVGDLEGVAALLATCRQIGGRRGVGFGQVREITVEPVTAEQCGWQQRNMPADSALADTHALAIGSLQAPYWDRRVHQPVLAPTNWLGG